MRRVIEYFAKSLKVIENGTIPKLGHGFLLATMAVSLAVSIQCTNVTDSQPDSQTLHNGTGFFGAYHRMTIMIVGSRKRRDSSFRDQNSQSKSQDFQQDYTTGG